jgi:hypothetical protein
MNKWVVRMVGVLMVLVFVMVMTMLYRQLVALQRAQQPQPAQTTTR